MNKNIFKKGQLAIFVIIGLLIIVGFGFVIFSSSEKSISNEVLSLSSTDLGSVEIYVEDTIKIVVNDGIFVEDIADISSLENYVNKNLKSKLDFATTYPNLNVDTNNEVISKIQLNANEDEYIISVDFPIKISSNVEGSNQVDISSFNVKVPLVVTKKLYLNGDKKTTINNNINALSGSAKFKISKDTQITNSNGDDVEDISMEVDVDNNYLNSVVFNMQPDGTHFDPPATFEFDYSLMMLTPGFSTNDLRVFLENDVTGDLEEVTDFTINVDKNTISARIPHFSDISFELELSAEENLFLTCVNENSTMDLLTLTNESIFSDCIELETFDERLSCSINKLENVGSVGTFITDYIQILNSCYDASFADKTNKNYPVTPTTKPAGEKPTTPANEGPPASNEGPTPALGTNTNLFELECVSGGVKEGETVSEDYIYKRIYNSTLDNEYLFDNIFTPGFTENSEIELSCNDGWMMTGCAAGTNGDYSLDSWMSGKNTCVGDQNGINFIYARCCRVNSNLDLIADTLVSNNNYNFVQGEANCRDIEVKGTAPNYFARAECEVGEVLSNGGGRCEFLDGNLGEGYMHMSQFDGNKSWLVDCYYAPNPNEAIAVATATCCDANTNSGMVGVLINTAQEQQTRIEKLEEENKLLVDSLCQLNLDLEMCS